MARQILPRACQSRRISGTNRDGAVAGAQRVLIMAEFTNSDEFTNSELMACVLARELNDGEIVRVGVATPVAEAAVRMAHLSYGPNIELVFFGGRMNVAHLDSIPMPAFPWDRRVVRWTESYSDSGHRFDRLKDWHRHVFFIGGG